MILLYVNRRCIKIQRGDGLGVAEIGVKLETITLIMKTAYCLFCVLCDAWNSSNFKHPMDVVCVCVCCECAC